LVDGCSKDVSVYIAVIPVAWSVVRGKLRSYDVAAVDYGGG